MLNVNDIKVKNIRKSYTSKCHDEFKYVVRRIVRTVGEIKVYLGRKPRQD